MGDHAPAAVDPGERAEIERAIGRWDGATRIEHVERLRGLTNHSYKVVTGSGSVAVRLPGRGTDAYVDRDAERHHAQLAAALGIGAEILYSDNGALVSAFIEGRVLTPGILRAEPDTLARVGRQLRLLHDSQLDFVSRFDPVAVISDHRARLVDVPAGVDGLIRRIERLGPPMGLTPCHVDPWPENFVDAGDRLYLLDWEYSGMHEPAWDLADLVVEAGLDPEHREHLMHTYTGGDPDDDLSHRVDELGPVTDVLWGLWALVQERDGNRAHDFGGYGRRRLDRAARALA